MVESASVRHECCIQYIAYDLYVFVFTISTLFHFFFLLIFKYSNKKP